MEYKCYSCAKKNQRVKAGMGTNNLGPKTKFQIEQAANAGTNQIPFFGQAITNGLGNASVAMSTPPPHGTIQNSRYAKSGGNFWRKIGGFAKDWAYNNLQGIPFIGDNIANAVAPDYEYATKVGEKIGGFGKTIKDPLEGFAAGALNIVAPGAGTALKGADDAWDKKQNENIAEKDAMNKMPLSQTNPRFAKSGGRQDINKITPVEGGALEQVSSSGKKIHGRSHQEGGVLLNDEIEVEGREGIHDIDGETVISSATLENPETGNDFAAEMLELEEKKGYLEQRLAAEEKSGNNKNTIIVLKKKIKELDDAIAALYGKQEMVAKEKGLRDAQGNPNEKSQAVVPSPDNPNPSQQISKYGGSVRLKKKYQIGGSNVIPLLEEETTQTALPMPEFQATNPEPEGMYASNTQSLNPNPEATTSNSGLKDFMTAMQQQNPDYSYKAPPTVVPEEEKQKEYNPYNNTSKILPYYNTKQNNDKTYYSNIGNSNKAERNQNYYNQGLNYYSKFGGNTKRDTPQKLSSKYATSVVVPTNKINIPYAATIVPTKEEEVKLLTPTRLINEAKEKAKNIDYISKGAIKTNSEAEALEDLQPTPQVNNPVVSQNTNAQQPIIYYAPSSENNKSDEEKETEKQSKSSFSKTDNEYLKNNREYMIKFYLNKLEDIRRLNKGYIKAKFGGNFTRKKGAFGFNDTSIYGDFKQNNYEPFANSIFKSNDNKSPVYMSNIENKQQQNINNGSTDTGGEGTEKDDRWWFTKALSPIRDKAANNEKILRKRQEEIEKEKNTVKKPTATPYQFIGAMRDMATAIVSPRDNTSQSVTSTNQNPGATVTQSAPVTTTSTPKKVQQPIVTKQPHTEVKDDVRAFQEWNNLNYPNEDLKTDGKYGPKTKAAYEKRKEEWINKYNGKPLDGDKTVATKSDNFTNAVNSGGEIIIIDGVEAVKTADNKIIYKDGSTQNFAPAKISKYGGKYKTGGWIQKATKSIEKRGTEGKCSGSNFGGPGCPPGSKQYNLAVTFRNMARKKHKYGGRFKAQNGSTKYDPFKIKIPIDSPPLKLGPVPLNNYKSKPLYTPEELEDMRKKEKRSDIVEGVVGFLPTAIGGLNAIKTRRNYKPYSPVDYSQGVPSLYAMRNFYKQRAFNTKNENSNADLYTALNANINAGENSYSNISGLQSALSKQRSDIQAQNNKLSADVMANASNLELQKVTKQASDNKAIRDQNFKDEQDMQENEKLLAQEAVNNFAAMKNRRLDRQRDKRDCAALSKLPAWNQSAEMKRIVCASCPELCTEAV